MSSFLAFPSELGLVAHAIDPGTLLLERYEVRAKLAEGAMASVYRCFDRRAGIEVALKVFDPLRGADPVAQGRFAREFQILARLDHPGVARAFRFERVEDLDVLVLEYLEGERLTDRLARGPMPLAEVVAIGKALADALSDCHAAGVVHRDLKPSNVILHPERGPVILDFSVAWLSSAMTLTRTGALMGSPRYLAPETFSSTEVDERADVFALGAILFEALAGRPLRLADNMAELAASEGAIDAPPLSLLRPDISPALDAVVARAVAVRPEDRWATTSELARALEAPRGGSLRRLEPDLACLCCAGPLIIDLPICPGCGSATAWALEPGPYAVEVGSVPNPEAMAATLSRRFGAALTTSAARLGRRLQSLPAPLAVGLSRRSAESIAAHVRDAGGRAELVRAKAWLGPSLTPPAATAGEIFAAAGLHFAAVMAFGAALLALGADRRWLFLLPAFVGAASLPLVVRYLRKPLLSMTQARAARPTHPALGAVAAALGRLRSVRAQRLAASAVARAAPVLMAEVSSESPLAEEVMATLEVALGAALDLDGHQAVLAGRSRARLRARLSEAEGDPPRLALLSAEQGELTETAIAHDLAARQALEACERISRVLADRTGDV